MNFIDFAASHGLIVEHVIEGRWVRVKTVDHPKKRNGAYKYLGEVGFVQNHATMEQVAVWKDGARAGFVDKAGMRARAAISAAQEKARQAEARAEAEDMLHWAAFDVHPYLVAKGFPQEKGFVFNGELLIPMREFRHYKQINSLQRIAADGTKLFLSGGKAKGSVYFLGPLMSDERWLVEGYATGLSVLAALHELHRRAQVVVCFSAGNLSHIGRLAKELRPSAYVFADNDKSGAGVNAAKETGLPWLTTPEEETDANDYHARYGLRALAKLIREASVRARAATA